MSNLQIYIPLFVECQNFPCACSLTDLSYKSCVLQKFQVLYIICLQIQISLLNERKDGKLESVCCKKRQKIVPGQLLVCRVGDL